MRLVGVVAVLIVVLGTLRSAASTSCHADGAARSEGATPAAAASASLDGDWHRDRGP